MDDAPDGPGLGVVDVSSLAGVKLDLDLVGACGDDCVGCPGETAHACWVSAGRMDDACDGSEHTCVSDHTCDDHACYALLGADSPQDYEMFMSQVHLAIELLADASVEEVREFLRLNPDGALLNVSRGAVQFLGGCEDREIVAHAPVPRPVLEELLAQPDAVP